MKQVMDVRELPRRVGWVDSDLSFCEGCASCGLVASDFVLCLHGGPELQPDGHCRSFAAIPQEGCAP